MISYGICLSLSDLLCLVWSLILSLLLPMALFHSFLWLSNNSIMCIHTHFTVFIHASVDGHLGGFHVLTVVNSAAMNIEVHIYFQIIVLSRYMPQSGITGSYDNSIFYILWNLYTVFYIYISNNSVKGFSFLHTHSNIYYL